MISRCSIWLFPLLYTILFLPSLAEQVTAQDDHSVLRIDADHRLRAVYWDEGLFPQDGWAGFFTRHRSRVGLTWTPSQDWKVRAAVANEFFSWYRHRDKPDFTLDEIFFDNLYVKWTPTNIPVEVTLGRQNMPLGEGFVVMDGGPLDGSRSIYFNAARADILPADGHRITLFAMHQPAQDDLLPRINDADRALLEWDRDGVGIYYSGRIHGSDLSLYYLNTAQSSFTIDESNGLQDDHEDHLHTFGVRISTKIMQGLLLTAEADLQRGEHLVSGARENGSIPRHAFAWYGYASWDPAEGSAWMPSIDAGWYQYSGGTDREQLINNYWDPIFARWPKWSESFIYSLATLRGGIALWTDISAPWLELQWQPSERIAVRSMLQHLSDQAILRPNTERAAIGTLLIAEVKYAATDRLSGHLLLERMWYADGNAAIYANDYFWGRVELLYRWSDDLLP